MSVEELEIDDDEEFRPPYYPETKFWDDEVYHGSQRYCSTEYCRGADRFDEEWSSDTESWIAGWACPCGCEDQVWEYDPETKQWKDFY